MLVFRKKGDIDFLETMVNAAENCLEGAQMLKLALNGDKPPASFVDQIKALEDKGDQFTHEIFKGLNMVFVTPLDREDLMELAVRTDDVMDGIEATIARFDYLSVSYSDEYMKQFADVLIDSCQNMLDAFKLLAKKKYKQIQQHTRQINVLENEGDRLMREGIRTIFQNTKDPYHDFKLKEIYERLEETTDACEDVADILESVVLRYA